MTKSVATSNKPRKQHTPEFRQEALKLAERIGVAAAARELSLYESQLYAWRSKLKNAHSSSEREQEMAVEIARLKRQLAERDEDRGISAQSLTNREKTQVVDALRETHPTAELLNAIQLARSSYFYHRTSLRMGDKYATIRTRMAKIFNDNYRCYGYRRLHAMLRHEGLVLSEKVVRRLMAEEQLVVRRTRRRRYSSYYGEISPAPDNLIARDFKAVLPNQKWLTDITEFQLPEGKVWLSPVLDCFDGKVVSWSLSTHPNAELANTMLEKAIDTLKTSVRPIIHSDRGGHYRWPGWLERVNAAGLIRSMSRKGCSPDNAACEGFFGRLKNEMYYVGTGQA